MRFRHCFGHFPGGHLTQLPAKQGFLNRLSPVPMLRISPFPWVFGNAYWSQAPANQGFTNRLNSGRCSGFSLSIAHWSEPELPARIAGTSNSLNQRRNALFRHRFTQCDPTSDSVTLCCISTCDKYKSFPFIGITQWFTPISGPRMAFACHSSVSEPNTDH